MKNKNIIKILVLSIMLSSGYGGLNNISYAQDSSIEEKDAQVTEEKKDDTKVIKEARRENTEINDIAYGLGLDKSDQDMVYRSFGSPDVEDITYVGGADVDKYLGANGSIDSDQLSSSYVKSLPKDSGVIVKIATPQNITLITETQYANAAITAGVKDIEITIASPIKVTGESALTGVYKILENKGKKVDQDRTKLAQEELDTLTTVDKNNNGDAKYSPEKLAQVFIDAKKELAKEKENSGGSLTKEQIQEIITRVLKENDLGNVLSENNINIIINYFDKYQNSSAADSEDVLNSLNKISGGLIDKGKEFIQNEQENGNLDRIMNEDDSKGLVEKIVDFIVRLFNSLFGENKNNTGE